MLSCKWVRVLILPLMEPSGDVWGGEGGIYGSPFIQDRMSFSPQGAMRGNGR